MGDEDLNVIYRVIEPLTQSLNDKNDNVQKAAEKALEKIKSNKNSQ
ncbi:MAG: hypothetical protein KAV97_03805 [Actinomycetia bacterium]|nr:hypothetical protein [Actinomycetes bacterium]